MLRALAERGAGSLELAEGERPAFRYPQGDRPVSQAVLNRSQILALVAELAGAGGPAGVAGDGGPTRFVYTLPDGKTFQGQPVAGEGGLRYRIVPAAAPAAAPAPSPRPGAPEIERYLVRLVECGGSDLHLSSGEIPMVRLHGEMQRLEGEGRPLSPEQTARLVYPIVPPGNKQEFEDSNDTDFAYEIPDLARFRCNVFQDRKGLGAVFRVIPSKIPTAADLNIPQCLLDLCTLPKGLVLVTGPTGSGKSTTLAALIDHINRTRSAHIITIEDPIEFVHENHKCLVNQRQVHLHTKGFKAALRAALREDPDIVLVGEMRDLETIAIAIETAETGHLVFGTLHTSTAPSTVDRVIDQFPADRQSQIRVMLSESLKGVVSQTLLRRKEGGRVAAMEILIGIPAISNLIREGKTFQIPSIMQTGKKHGMVLLNDALAELVRKGVVTQEEALSKAVDRTGLASQLRAGGSGS
jgi:twitching motility protein PilT